MHHLYFVLLPHTEDVSTPKSAMQEVTTILDHEWFTNTGYFWFWKGDRFEIWWRWTWVLNKDYLENQEAYYDRTVHDDNAQLLTNEKITYLRTLYDGDVEVYLSEEYHEIMTKDLTDEYLGMRIVVVDYHE